MTALDTTTVAFATAGAGVTVAGPDVDSLTTSLVHNGPVHAGVVVAAFSYDTTSPNSRGLGSAVTYAGRPMELLIRRGKGWGLPQVGYLEVWGTANTMEGDNTIGVELAYTQDAGDPWAPEHVDITNFTGSTVSFDNALGFGAVHGWSSDSKVVGLPVSAFMNTITIGVVASNGAMEDVLSGQTLFADAGKHLAIGMLHGPGAFRGITAGGPWAGATVNLSTAQPAHDAPVPPALPIW